MNIAAVHRGAVVVAVVAVVVVLCMGAWFSVPSRGATQAATRPVGVAVVEMFTSEGCSSCPPAERVLGDLARRAEQDKRPVYTLAFHVDYWDHDGWADRFSDAAYTKRQWDYANTHKLDTVYTPQMVVNGQWQFPGSKRDTAERAVAKALATPAVTAVTLTVRGKAAEGYNVRADVTGAAAGAVVNVAVVERDLSTDVTAGENRGRRVEEPSVVRWFKSVPAVGAGDVVVPPLADVRADRASVVVYVQQAGSGPIVGAAAAPLP